MNIDGKEGTLILDLSDPARCKAFAAGEPLPETRGYFNEPRAQSANIIDLTRRYEIAIERTPIGWAATDRVTYDPDPESALCITGHGKTTQEAVTDLLEQLAAVTVSEAFANRKPL